MTIFHWLFHTERPISLELVYCDRCNAPDPDSSLFWKTEDPPTGRNAGCFRSAKSGSESDWLDCQRDWDEKADPPMLKGTGTAMSAMFHDRTLLSSTVLN